jgi:polyhydroxyalkanoate synthase
MNKRAQSSAQLKAPKQENARAAAPPELILTPETIDALSEIVEGSSDLLQSYIERLKTEDGYQVIDQRTVTSTLQELLAKARANPASVINEQMRLWTDLVSLWQNTAARILLNKQAEPVIEPGKSDKRFKNEAWVENPYFDFVKQYYLLMSRYFESSVRSIPDVDPHTRHKAQFYTRQFMSALSPTNFVTTNPVVMETTIEKRGENLINGLRNLVADLRRGDGRLTLRMADTEAFKFGENIASSPGKVIFQNELMQLIQYAPTTASVQRRPLLIVPPWINKFYILDLKPKNSFIKWCVDQGHTVFVISWVNPGAELAAKSFSDYLLEGPLAAIGAIERATGEAEVNVIGYCIGGTVVASTLAYMAATGDNRIASATLFTTLLDFADVGDISVFIDAEQLELADKHMV